MKEVKLTLSLSVDKRLSDTIIKTLTPDNVNFPEGLNIELKEEDGNLHIIFICRNIKRINSMINMVDEVLQHISLILKMVE